MIGPPPLPPAFPDATTDDVAHWMLAELARRDGTLAYDTAALEIVRLFGGHFSNALADDRLAISPDVLAKFDALARVSPREVVWEEPARRWSLRARPSAPYR